MDPERQPRRDYGFAIGLLTGTFVGAGLAIWFAPRAAAELRDRLADRAAGLGQRAAGRYQQVRVRVGDAIDEVTRDAQGVRDRFADGVARGAHEVERFAAAAKVASSSGRRDDPSSEMPPNSPRERE